MRLLYQHEEPSWITTKPVVASNWDACLQTLSPDGSGYGTTVVFATNGHCFASLVESKICLWDTMTGACFQTIHIGTRTPWGYPLAFTPDSQMVVVQIHTRHSEPSIKNVVELWDVKTGVRTQILHEHDNVVYDATTAIVSGELQVAVGGQDHQVKIWDAKTGVCLRTLKGHTDSVGSVAFSPNGLQLVSGSHDHTVKIWDSLTGMCLRTLEGHDGVVSGVAYAPNGTLVASAPPDGSIRVWDATTGLVLRTLKGHEGGVNSVRFAPREQKIVSASSDRTIKIWDTTTGTCLNTFNGHTQPASSAVFSPDAQHVVSSTFDGTVKFWDVMRAQRVGQLEANEDAIELMESTQDGRFVASYSWWGPVKIWDPATGVCLHSLEGPGEDVSITCSSFSPDGLLFALAISDGRVQLWDWATETCMRIQKYQRAAVKALAFSTDGSRLIASSKSCDIRIWDVTTGSCLYIVEGIGSNTSAFPIRMGPDTSPVPITLHDRSLLVLDSFGKVEVWDVSAGICLHTIAETERKILQACFLDNGLRIASISDDNMIQVWDGASGICLQTLDRDHADSIRLSETNFRQSEYSITGDHSWITRNGRGVLWLPERARPQDTFVKAEHKIACLGNLVLIGARSGQVIKIEFA